MLMDAHAAFQPLSRLLVFWIVCNGVPTPLLSYRNASPGAPHCGHDVAKVEVSLRHSEQGERAMVVYWRNVRRKASRDP